VQYCGETVIPVSPFQQQSFTQGDLDAYRLNRRADIQLDARFTRTFD
jgi:hypothetical protein